eukprot:scaffold2456_cov129-Isochrysis_galbana.AAC.4
MSISSYASDLSAASLSHSCEITHQSNPSPQSGMVQPVVNEMFATVHTAGSSLLGISLMTSHITSDRALKQNAVTGADTGARATPPHTAHSVPNRTPGTQ